MRWMEPRVVSSLAVALVISAMCAACNDEPMERGGDPDGSTRMDAASRSDSGARPPTPGEPPPTRDGSVPPDPPPMVRDGSVPPPPDRDGSRPPPPPPDPADGGRPTGRDASVEPEDAFVRPDSATAGPGRIGEICYSEEDCDGRICTQSGSPGFCSFLCAEDAPCPDGAYCLYYTESIGYCLARCDDSHPCPVGNVCIDGFGLPERVCYPGCASDDECPMGTECVEGSDGVSRCTTAGSKLGDACELDAQCPRDSICASESVWGYPGGMCLVFGCGFGGLACPDEGACVESGAEAGACVSRCEADADCRTGYACVPLGDGSNICAPRCRSNADCSDGRTCSPLSGLCSGE